MNRESQRFSRSEIRAELLRQEIQELELKIQNDGPNSTHAITDARELERRRGQLAAVRPEAEFNTQGRAALDKVYKLADQAHKSGDIPPGTEDAVKDVAVWFDALAKEKKSRNQRQIAVYKSLWPHADWRRRGQMVRSIVSDRYTNLAPRVLLGVGRFVTGYLSRRILKK